jgi:hypothetical protein
MRRTLIVVMVLLSLVAAPIAMALDGCSGTGTVCGMTCSAPCTATSAPMSGFAMVAAGSTTSDLFSHVPMAVLTPLDAPPKSPLSA